MGVGLWLNGRFKAPAKRSKDPVRDWLTAVQNWFDDDIAGDAVWGNLLPRCHQGTTHDDKPALFVALHPAGDDVEFIVPESGHLTVSAKTSTVGPGYHTTLCDLLHRFGKDMNVKWNPEGEHDDDSQDETGYFFHHDRAAVERELMLYLNKMAEISLETLEETGHGLQAWHMPMGFSFSEYPGDLQTPMGMRSEKWIRSIRDDPRRGIDIFPWWDDGLGPSFFLGRALCGMWSKVRWRPALTEEEYDEWHQIHRDLCLAYEADPSRAYPWREWAELIDILNESEGAGMVTRDVAEEVRDRAAKVPAKQPLIGYRRYPARVHLTESWSIRIPGEMAEAWEDESWSACDAERTVWFSSWTITKDGTDVPAKKLLDDMKLHKGDMLRHRAGKLIGKAVLRETTEDGKRLRNLQAYSAVDGSAALCNVFYAKRKDDEWA